MLNAPESQQNVAENDSQPLATLLADDMKNVDALIEQGISNRDALIPQVAGHLLNAGGKRARPMLTAASARLFGGVPKERIPLAAAIELMHSATLLHDDVVDESPLRRGKPTARVLWSNQGSVLVGDFLLGQAFRMMVAAQSLEALRILSTAAAKIAEGEVMQLAAVRRLNVERAEYLRIIDAKTAALFAAAAEAGATVAGASDEQKRRMRTFGRNLGMAFQIIDDVLDYEGEDEFGKSQGGDLREGKSTLPTILARRQAPPSEETFWRRTLSGKARRGDSERARQILEARGALSAARREAKRHAESAVKALRTCPRSEWRDALERLAIEGSSRRR